MLKFRCNIASLSELTRASAIKRIWYFSSKGLSILHFLPRNVEQMFPARMFREGMKIRLPGKDWRQKGNDEMWVKRPSKGEVFLEIATLTDLEGLLVYLASAI